MMLYCQPSTLTRAEERNNTAESFIEERAADDRSTLHLARLVTASANQEAMGKIHAAACLKWTKTTEWVVLIPKE